MSLIVLDTDVASFNRSMTDASSPSRANLVNPSTGSALSRDCDNKEQAGGPWNTTVLPDATATLRYAR